MEVGMHQAKTTLSELIKKLHEDDHVDIVITRSGQPVARLIRYEPLVAPRTPGRLAGKITITDDFDATPDEVIEAFYR
ncbi:MAG TPA: type II toxin-antitoxin system prevent-host-death family antitoxin [Gordonia sp. (in: high G+C Gram-positive bacteria)]|uniref:type II toxin-antitoxin system Phd/YefM family antitoxin n=1 Tax=unclassified Gordonia (in: high G+C Gram-positive bacteria) TaxID=2657482 RepID=UPI000FA4EFC2|nr:MULTISPECIES: type II toxin-antitoxin system prevent-host-death family antitoxin [unclassified Gordonia (in: high G+C Gram-positive bacteria)]RUP39306.1 MAG: type II toxin-antitoxin system prevent-host-death family antitoxin [Gordonia sp. (in: high G+C Gram-positive bacteria)]HNP55723.1 type II toxin-antitoxin system prevent-host-death family antitoxin [Gordonia sp. (in: high G+C Gram-positive bacteria)]HRC49459.1 type II toxin-antitoxin system prevent-host-death family antitoxin [Gordonia sp